MKSTKAGMVILFIATLLIIPVVQAETYSVVKKINLQKINLGKDLFCVRTKAGKAWNATKKNGKKYTTLSKSDANSSKAKQFCKSLLKGKVGSLSSIPSLTALVRSKQATTSSKNVKSKAVSGTPPTILEVAQFVSNYFWEDGLISSIIGSSPSQQQCGDFWGGGRDGSSSGFTGCYMAQGTAFTLQNMLQFGMSACYLKGFPSQQNLDAGGIEVVSGTLPTGGINQVMSPPSGGTARLVRVNISDPDFGDQAAFIKVLAQNQLNAQALTYGFDLYFCSPDGSVALGYEKTRIATSGRYTSEQGSQEEGSFFGTISAYLTSQGGELIFDPSKDRRVSMLSDFDHGTSKSELIVTNTNKIYNKELSSFSSSDGLRSSYSIARFTGSSTADLRFESGAYKDSQPFGDFEGAVEFRDSTYVSAPSSSLLSELDQVNLSSSFYSSLSSPEIDLSPYDCSAEADIVLNLDMTNSFMEGVKQDCEGERLDGMNFCDNETLQLAMANYNNVCQQQGPQS